MRTIFNYTGGKAEEKITRTAHDRRHQEKQKIDRGSTRITADQNQMNQKPNEMTFCLIRVHPPKSAVSLLRLRRSRAIW
jgi:hypothetical protein